MINPGQSFAQGAPDLVISHGRNPATMTRAAVDALGGMKRFVKPGNKVVIKPNMSFASGPQAASNTHPAVVSEVARMCSEAGASRISILDNPLQQPQDCLAMSKIPEMCEVVPNTRVHVIKPQRLFRQVKVDRGTLVKIHGSGVRGIGFRCANFRPCGQNARICRSQPFYEGNDGPDL